MLQDNVVDSNVSLVRYAVVNSLYFVRFSPYNALVGTSFLEIHLTIFVVEQGLSVILIRLI